MKPMTKMQGFCETAKFFCEKSVKFCEKCENNFIDKIRNRLNIDFQSFINSFFLGNK